MNTTTNTEKLNLTRTATGLGRLAARTQSGAIEQGKRRELDKNAAWIADRAKVAGLDYLDWLAGWQDELAELAA